MSRSALELEILRWVMDDYEAPHTIVGDIARELGREVSESKVLGALLSLARDGLVQAFVYDAGSQRFQLADHDATSVPTDLWFLATPSGVAEYGRLAG